MRDEYYQLIESNKLPEVLSFISDISYSKKCDILKELLSRYDSSTVDVALYNYKKRYIDLHRVISYLLKNVLIGLCNEQVKKRNV